MAPVKHRKSMAKRRYKRSMEFPKTFGQYVPAVAAAIAAATGGSNTGTKTDENATGGGISGQIDRVVQYRKKKMPAKKKKAWKRKIKQNRAMDIKALGTRSILLNHSIADNIPIADNGQKAQVIGFKSNWGVVDNATNLMGLRDYAIISSNDSGADQTTEAFIVTSAIIDVTYSNTGTISLEVDVYTVRARNSGNHGADPLTELADAATETTTIGAAASLQITDRGSTPFDFPLFAKRGNTILSKTKHFVPAGSTFTVQQRDARNVYMPSSAIVKANGTDYTYKGETVYYLFITKKVIGYTSTLGTWVIGASRKYTYKVMEGNAVRDGRIP